MYSTALAAIHSIAGFPPNPTDMTASAQAIETLEFERKHLIPRARLEAAIHCLDSLCRRDPRYPDNVVSSIYFDTPGLRLLQEKEDSALYKTKVRLRWYEHPNHGPLGHSSFLEVKSRVGQRRAKQRLPAGLEPTWLARVALTEPQLLAAPRLLEQDPTVAIRGLKPILVVRYRRRRWNDPTTGSRVSLDQAISVPRVNPGVLPRSRSVDLPHIVLEIKNASGMAPPNLHFVKALKGETSSFSKYFECFKAVTSSDARVA